ncbi:MAG: hypothetical protein IKE28_12370 [Solobacterium sp.]|nr:hypothetical protein [Solobacterium sp.]
MKNSRLFKVFVSLFMVVGMLFSADGVKAEEAPVNWTANMPEATINPIEGGTVTAGIVNEGNKYQYEANPAEGYSFKKWNYKTSESDEERALTDNPIQFDSSIYSIQAIFSANNNDEENPANLRSDTWTLDVSTVEKTITITAPTNNPFKQGDEYKLGFYHTENGQQFGQIYIGTLNDTELLNNTITLNSDRIGYTTGCSDSDIIKLQKKTGVDDYGDVYGDVTTFTGKAIFENNVFRNIGSVTQVGSNLVFTGITYSDKTLDPSTENYYNAGIIIDDNPNHTLYCSKQTKAQTTDTITLPFLTLPLSEFYGPAIIPGDYTVYLEALNSRFYFENVDIDKSSSVNGSISTNDGGSNFTITMSKDFSNIENQQSYDLTLVSSTTPSNKYVLHLNDNSKPFEEVKNTDQVITSYVRTFSNNEFSVSPTDELPEGDYKVYMTVNGPTGSVIYNLSKSGTIHFKEKKNSGGGGGGGDDGSSIPDAPQKGPKLTVTLSDSNQDNVSDTLTVTADGDQPFFTPGMGQNYKLSLTQSSKDPRGYYVSISGYIGTSETNELNVPLADLGYYPAGSYYVYFVNPGDRGAVNSYFAVSNSVTFSTDINKSDITIGTVTLSSDKTKVLITLPDSIQINSEDKNTLILTRGKSMIRVGGLQLTVEGSNTGTKTYSVSTNDLRNHCSWPIDAEYEVTFIHSNESTGYKLSGSVNYTNTIPVFGTIYTADETKKVFAVRKTNDGVDFPAGGVKFFVTKYDKDNPNSYAGEMISPFWCAMHQNVEDADTMLIYVDEDTFPKQASGFVKEIYFAHNIGGSIYKLVISGEKIEIGQKTQLRKGVCTIQPGSHIDENLKLSMSCVTDDGKNIISDFPDSSLYLFLPEGTNQTSNMITFFLGHKKDDTIEFYQSDIQNQNKLVTPGTYDNVKFWVKLIGEMSLDFFQGTVVNSNGGNEIVVGNVLKQAPSKLTFDNSYTYEYTDDNNINHSIPGVLLKPNNTNIDKTEFLKYINNYHDNEGPTQDSIYSQMKFFREDGTSEHGKNFLSLCDAGGADSHHTVVIDNGTDLGLFISAEDLKRIGIQKNTPYRVDVSVCGYECVTLSNDDRLNISNGVTTINGLSDFELSFTQDKDTEDSDVIFKVGSNLTPQQKINYFKSITSLTITSGNGGTTYFDEVKENDKTADAYIITPENSNDPELHIKSNVIVGTPNAYAYMNVTSNEYVRQYVTGKLYYCKRFQPSDLTTKVQTDGIHIYSKKIEYLENLENVRMRINRVGASTAKDFELKDYVKRSTINNNERVIALTLNDLLTINNGNVDIDSPYWSYIDSENYVSWWNHNSLSMNPIRFAAGVNTAHSTTTPENLDELDDLAKNLENGYVVRSDNMTDPTNQGVSIDGAIAGAIASNNENREPDYSDINSCAGEVLVTRTVSALDNTTEENIIGHSGLTNVNGVGIKFGIKIMRDADEIYQLPFNAALRFDLPDNLDVKDGQVLYLISQHKVGNTVTYPRYTVFVKEDTNTQKRYGVAYVDQYSDFVLVTADEAKDDPKPSNTSKKSSTTTNTSNVVTCQMAGYPANYAWNEAAKACQPGYINDNGVFVSTAGTTTGNRVKAVNTWDNGLRGSITALIASTIATVFAAYALRKWS